MKKAGIMLILLQLVSLMWSEDIRLEDILNSVKETHPSFGVEAMIPAILEAENESLNDTDQWQISGKGYYNHSEYDMLNPAYNSSDTFYAKGEISRTLWSTGGSLKASVNTQFTDFNHLAVPNSFWGNGIMVSYSHPLLKNEHGFLNKFQYNLNAFEVDLSKLESEIKLETLYKQAAVNFLMWISLQEQEKILNRRLVISREEVDYINAKLKENLVEKVDLLRAEECVWSIHREILSLQNRKNHTVSHLSKISGISDLHQYNPYFTVMNIPELPDLKQENDYLRENNKFLEILGIEKEKLEYLKRGYTEQLKPDLQVFVELGISSKEEYMPRALLMDNPVTTVGATISFPLGNLKPEAQIHAADLKARKLEYEKIEVLNNYETEINIIITQLSSFESVFDMNREMIAASNRRITEEKQLYDKGLGDIKSLLQGRDNQVQLELDNLVNRVEYHLLCLELDYLQGRLSKGETWVK